MNLGVPLFNLVGCGSHIHLHIQKTSEGGPTDFFNGSPLMSLSVDRPLFRLNCKPSPYSLDGDSRFLVPVINKNLFFTAFNEVNRLKKVKLLRSFASVDKTIKKVKIPK